MQIIQAPDKVLSEKAKAIAIKSGKIDSTALDLIEKMKITLVEQKDPEGIGLAAPQVGKSLQLFIIKETKESPFFVFINPEIKLLGQRKTTTMPKKNPRLEGCLSLKDIWGTVKRAPRVTITYFDEKGEKHVETHKGFFATIIQHEYDHLQGVLFPKRTLEQQGQLYHSRKDENGEEVFDPIKV